MAATTSWSNQLTRLFNAPLDKESVFDTKNDLLEYLKRDEIPYEGQIVAIIDNTDGTETDKVMRIYAIAKDSNGTLPDSDVTLGDHGNRWYLLTIGTSNFVPDYSEETGKLKNKVNIKIKENSDFDGKTGVDFDGSTNIEIPLELKVQDQLKNIDDTSDTTVDKAKEIASNTLDNYTNSELEYYDFSFFLKWKGEEKDTVITGNKHHNLEAITWVKS